MSPVQIQDARARRSTASEPRRQSHSPVATFSAPEFEAAGSSRVLGVERRLARRLLRAIGDPPIRLALWNGEEIAAGDDALLARIVFRDRAAFWRVIFDPDLQFGDAYSAGRVEVEGDLVAVLETIGRAWAAVRGSDGIVPSALLRAARRVRGNSRRGARDNIHHHYDIGNDFYRLWLDADMVYSGAYFAEPAMSLDEAQRAKLRYVGRKLWLRPGERVVEVGGGWGGLALLLAREFGVRVTSYNISREQIAWARRRTREEGLGDRVEFVEDDYRNISGRFDAFVSLGMLEHVGTAHYREFGRMMDRCLAPDGRGLIQSIGQDRKGETSRWIERRIFPGAYPPSLREMSDLFEPSWFSILDVENLRLHYAQTLRCWLDRFEASAGAVARMFDERFVRMWRLYLAGSCAAFRSGGLQLFQVVFTRPGMNEIPRTRVGRIDGASARMIDRFRMADGVG